MFEGLKSVFIVTISFRAAKYQKFQFPHIIRRLVPQIRGIRKVYPLDFDNIFVAL